MSLIIIGLVLAGIYLGRQAYFIATYVRQNKGRKPKLTIHLPMSFYVGKMVTLLSLGLFFFALNPVPAGLALAGAVGILIETFLSVYTYSIRAMKEDQ